MERSATFRDLNAGLDTQTSSSTSGFRPAPEACTACLVWVSPAADARRLLIKVDRFGRSPDELTALLAHELQHANEVASDPEITDLASFQKSFASRGWKHGAGFETGEAIRIAKTVSAEMSRTQGPYHRSLGISAFANPIVFGLIDSALPPMGTLI